jgi:hypothetical protein
VRRACLIAVTSASLLGCAPAGTAGTPQVVTLRNDATARMRVLVGPFTPGSASVDPARAIADQVLNARGEGTISLPPGRYSVEASAQTPERETAVTQFTLRAGEPQTLTLVERFELFQGPGDTSPRNRRLIGWSE